jgi:hypothetical protein
MKKTVIVYMILQSVLLAAQENGEKYVWPLTIDNGISSTFQEFRSNHFHAGIDLRTFQTTGFPVLAIADGVIEKIIVSWSGIGRAIFLRHSDGNLSLYGHLEKFRNDVESLVVREQKRSHEKYFGTYVLAEPLPVRRGDVIAFSGESGNGLPHLHLEIRDKLNASLNPLSFVNSPLADRDPPILKGILMRSRADCLLNDDLGEFYFKLHKAGPLYIVSESIAVTGPFDLILHALDFAEGGHAVAPYSVQAYLDGKPCFQVIFDRLLRDDNNQLGMMYDMAYSSSSSYFYKLYSQSGFNLEMSKAMFDEDIRRLTPGPHEIKVIVMDRQQNQAVALIPIQKLPDRDGVPLNKKIDLQANVDRVLLDDNLEIYVNRDDVVIKIRDFPRPAGLIKLKITQGDREQVLAAREFGSGVYFYFKPPGDEMSLQMRFMLTDGRQPVEELQKNINLLVLKSQSARQFRQGEFIADFAAKAVLEPTVLLLKNAQLTADYPMLAGPVSIGPTHFTFLDTVLFKFRIPPGQAMPEQLGIFKYQPLAKSWSYVNTRDASESGFLESRVLTGGIFALLRDIYPPAIHFRSRRSRRLATCKKIAVRLGDRGKGIDEKTLAVFLNGRKMDFEYDPDRGQVFIEAGAGSRPGKNDLLVRVADFGGNRSEKIFHFHLR